MAASAVLGEAMFIPVAGTISLLCWEANGRCRDGTAAAEAADKATASECAVEARPAAGMKPTEQEPKQPLHKCTKMGIREMRRTQQRNT